MKIKMSIISCFFYIIIFGQDYEANFERYYKQKDTSNQLKTLSEWEKSNEKSPEFYISYYKYYISKSDVKNPNGPKYKEAVISEYDVNSEDVFRDPILGNFKFFNYKKSFLNKALMMLDMGIKHYPNRLDMRLSKIYCLGIVYQCNTIPTEMIKAIEFSVKNNNQWKWTKNESLKNGENVFFDLIRKYQNNTCSRHYEIKENLKRRYLVNKEILKYYPNNFSNLISIAHFHKSNKNFNEALKFLKSAEKIDSESQGVIETLADVYYLKNDTLQALKFYKKLRDGNYYYRKAYAKSKIEKLQKK